MVEKMKNYIEFRHNTKPTLSPEYEIIKWQGKTCYTVAIFKYNEREPCWYLRTIGDRMVGLDPTEFMREVEKGFKYLERKGRL